MFNKKTNTQEPPPAYQGANANVAAPPGETYYQPPAHPPPPEGGYAPPPPSHPPMNNNNMGARFTQFYTPPQNRTLGLKRRLCSAICCCILIGLIVGLATGLTRRHSGYNQCDCRTNADCYRYYGPTTYCYSNCQCVRR